jgi:hypothetical protein
MFYHKITYPLHLYATHLTITTKGKKLGDGQEALRLAGSTS